MRRKPPIVKTVLLPGREMFPDGHGGFTIGPPVSAPWPSISEAYKQMGKIGGMAGTGDAKARDPEKMRAAARKRWKRDKLCSGK